MIKVNLLHNSIERTGVEAVETAISSRGTRQILLVLIAVGAGLAACVIDYVTTVRTNTRVRDELAVEQKTAAQLQELNKQVTELQSKSKAVEDRIAAIQRLRADQIGPLRLLQMVDARLPADRDFRLSAIKQDKDSVIIISGYSPSEAKVTEFAQRLEFASNLFSRFHVETRRVANPEKTGQGNKADAETDRPENEVVEFVIRCMYSPESLLANELTQPATDGTKATTAATAGSVVTAPARQPGSAPTAETPARN